MRVVVNAIQGLCLITLAACGSGGSNAPPPATLGGTVTGLTGRGLVLQNNGTGSLTISANGAFQFSAAVAVGDPYDVTVQESPSYPAQMCAVTNGSGTISSTNVTNVGIICANLPVAALQVGSSAQSAMLIWSNPSASSFNVYVSTALDCDVTSYASCPGGEKLANVTSPYTVTGLKTGQVYFFRLESVFPSGARGLADGSTRSNMLSTDGEVAAIAIGPDGTVYVGGSFSRVGSVPGRAVPLDGASGQPIIPNFPETNEPVQAEAPDGAGGWYLGGQFTAVGGVTQSYVVHVLTSGLVDPNFSPTLDGEVTALVVAGGVVYLSGTFSHADSQPRQSLAAVNGASGAVLPWNPGADAPARALLISGSTLYAGGAFRVVGGSARNSLAAIDAISGTVLPWAPDAIANNDYVNALALSGNTLYVGGLFFILDGSKGNHLTAVDATTGAALPWTTYPSDEVLAIAVANGIVYIGGPFTSINGIPRNHLAALGSAGLLLPWNPNANGGVAALAVAGGTVFAGGSFTAIGGSPRNYAAALDANTGTVLPWNPDADVRVSVLAASGGTICVGGGFTRIGGSPRDNLAAFDASGVLSPWRADVTAPASVGASVNAIAVTDTTVYVGGTFTSIGGAARQSLAALDAASGAVLPWDPTLANVGGLTPQVSAIALSGNTVYVGGGGIAQAGGANRNYLAAIDATTGNVLPWDPNPNLPVNTLAVSAGTVYAGGTFTSVAGIPRNYFAAIDATTGALLSPNPNPNAPVTALAALDTSVYAGGNFTAVGTAMTNGIAAVDGSSGNVLPWNPNPFSPGNPPASVTALAASGNTIYVAGQFQVFAGSTRNGIAAINTNGALLPWDPDLLSATSANTVRAISVTGNVVYLGGSFNAVGGTMRGNLAAFDAVSGVLLP